ncbi:MAG: hypothetical protein NWQ19_03155 [Nonlabens sp.]|nr:hypothetical protein [Nonlabens sp.]
MKNLIICVLLFSCAISSLAQKLPAKVNLETYAPLGYEPYLKYAAIKHHFQGDVYIFQEIQVKGWVNESKFYDKDKKKFAVIKSTDYEFGFKESYSATFNKNGQISSETIENGTENTIKYEYDYDVNGMVRKVSTFRRAQIKKDQYAFKLKEETSYKYDELKRLITRNTDSFAYAVSKKELVITTYREGAKSSTSIYDVYGANIKGILHEKDGSETVTNYKNFYDHKGNIVVTTNDKSRTPSVYKFTYYDGTVSELPKGLFEFVPLVKEDKSEKYNGYDNRIATARSFMTNGKLSGPGKRIVYGVEMEGEFKDDMLHGFGTVSNLSHPQTITIGQFTKGKLNGLGIEIVQGNVVNQGIYKNGLLIEKLGTSTKTAAEQSTCSENCPVVFVEKKEIFQTAYGFHKGKTPIGPLYVSSDNKSNRVSGMLGDDGTWLFYNGKTADLDVLLGQLKNNMLHGKVYRAKGENYDSGIYENNVLIKKI